jgi:hypothetical protein
MSTRSLRRASSRAASLPSLAGYEVWGGVVAHISVITHPAFRRPRVRAQRSRAPGRRCLGCKGLVPQYRTLESNRPSMRIAESLGFVHYASSVAVRLKRAGPANEVVDRSKP